MSRLPASIAAALLVMLLALAAVAQLSRAEDWPQWQGSNRNGKSNETGLLKKWPEGGPKRLWMYSDCGVGFGGPAIVDGKIYIMGGRNGEDYLLCLDAANADKATELWHAPLGETLKNDWSDGSRGTPTVAGGNVYTLSGTGTLVCVRASDGKEIWRKTMQELGGSIPKWGFAESVLVDGDRVLCTPGGPEGAIAALDKNTGKLLWQAKELNDPAHYSSVIRATFHGQPQYVQLLTTRLVGLAVDTGKVLWQVDFNGDVACIPTPIAWDNKVFATSGYSAHCMLVEIGDDNTATQVFENQVLQNHHGGVIKIGDYLYGHCDDVGWICMDANNGKRIWRIRDNVLGKGAITYADGLFYCVTESDGEADANVALIEPSPAPEGWKEISHFALNPQTSIRKPAGRIWTHPVIANGRLYLRDQDLLYCYEVKAQ